MSSSPPVLKQQKVQGQVNDENNSNSSVGSISVNVDVNDKVDVDIQQEKPNYPKTETDITNASSNSTANRASLNDDDDCDNNNNNNAVASKVDDTDDTPVLLSAASHPNNNNTSFTFETLQLMEQFIKDYSKRIGFKFKKSYTYDTKKKDEDEKFVVRGKYNCIQKIDDENNNGKCPFIIHFGSKREPGTTLPSYYKFNKCCFDHCHELSPKVILTNVSYKDSIDQLTTMEKNFIKVHTNMHPTALSQLMYLNYGVRYCNDMIGQLKSDYLKELYDDTIITTTNTECTTPKVLNNNKKTPKKETVKKSKQLLPNETSTSTPATTSTTTVNQIIQGHDTSRASSLGNDQVPIVPNNNNNNNKRSRKCTIEPTFPQWLKDNFISIDLVDDFIDIGIRNPRDLAMVVNHYRHLLACFTALDQIKIINSITKDSILSQL